MIYLLKHPDHGEVLIGSSDWIASFRRRLAADGFSDARSRFSHMEKGLHPWLRKLECIGMCEGDEAAAEAVRERFWAETRTIEYGNNYLTPLDFDSWDPQCRWEVPWRWATPGFLSWKGANTVPWDGSEAEKLGIKGLPRHRPTARATTLAERLARRRK